MRVAPEGPEGVVEVEYEDFWQGTVVCECARKEEGGVEVGRCC